MSSQVDSIKLIFWAVDDLGVYLEIPNERVQSLCKKPLKWLHYAAWCILGLEGHISSQPGGETLDEDSMNTLPSGSVYYYVTGISTPPLILAYNMLTRRALQAKTT
ncbi:hypothetical protein AX16_007742 [Volvariella volvacea WC 439]|nr:hypothetical protein AX16_007742 [Volvariella volvacea WC 439]